MSSHQKRMGYLKKSQKSFLKAENWHTSACEQFNMLLFQEICCFASVLKVNFVDILMQTRMGKDSTQRLNNKLYQRPNNSAINF